ncbi:PAAR-like protein [Chryseobacterium caseinilyticum]|uniref:DUF4280 domain-containing protein n=1 Tax=Chryseobacterium caseinilyticum TaxID=2771428 RepID=A0ABR8ZC84_9FLAO|nr:PAAR-like protein [Chryseobacterium caseinilyticum]MBD8082510.1 DUF4280 domain-containing protein [Chryseobacterium caseinilyticum]
MAKKYVPEGAFTACNKGTSPSTLRVSNNKSTTIYSVPMATELDFLPFFNLKPMGFCSSPMKWMTGITCLPTVTGWQQPKDGVKINGSRMLLEDSYCDCIFGGKINIFFDRAAAVSFGLGEGKMPSEYIKEGFDWLEQKNKESREARDSFLPDWMKPVTGVSDWMNDLGTGLVEGAVNGVVGLGETLYQVGQDPVGTAEALGGMIKDGATAAWEGAGNAYDWASKGENWNNAAEGAWNWASDGQNWVDAGNATVQGVKDAGNWVAQNPRKIGTTVGEFIPDAVAAAYTAGGSLAVTGAKVAGKEVLEEAGERVVREALEEGAEKAGKETLEAGAKRSTAEVLEQLAKKEGGDIAKVTDGAVDDIAGLANKKPSYKIGESDGGPGTWENRHSPKKGADYQKKTTGAPDDTEYVVKTDKMKSGEKKFDGYDPETNSLQDSKDWDKWPPKGDSDWARRRRQQMLDSARKDAEIAQEAGSKLEWHVPTQAKADELADLFDDANIDIDVIVVPK